MLLRDILWLIAGALDTGVNKIPYNCAVISVFNITPKAATRARHPELALVVEMHPSRASVIWVSGMIMSHMERYPSKPVQKRRVSYAFTNLTPKATTSPPSPVRPAPLHRLHSRPPRCWISVISRKPQHLPDDPPRLRHRTLMRLPPQHLPLVKTLGPLVGTF